MREARDELERADRLKPDMPETLYGLGKAASLSGEAALAEKAWLHVIEIEKQTSLAAQAHFGLAALYRKQGKPAQAESEMQEFRKLQQAVPQPDDRSK
jgi:tetratricopeptide (TPR) repeat protein